jgi:RsmE family RNA methyltransferase
VNLVLLERSEADGCGEWGDITLDGVRGRHIAGILNARPGRQIRIGIIDGPRGVATLVSTVNETVTLRCAFETSIPTVPRVDLLMALPRPKVLRRLWAQLAAVGVGRIILTNAERVERHYFDTHVVTPDCYRPLLIEGLQQARDTRLPQVSVHRRFKVLVEDELEALFPGRLRLVADPSASLSIARAVSARDSGTAPEGRRVLLAIGPEGGWNDFERGLLEGHGFTTVSLGSRTLRTDTACIALLALVHESLRASGSGPGAGASEA